MRVHTAAALPALSVLLGVSIVAVSGAVAPMLLGVQVDVVLLVVAWGASVAAYLRRRARCFVICIAVGFATAGALLAARAISAAEHTPLSAAYEKLTLVDKQEGPSYIEGRLRGDAVRTPFGATLDVHADVIEMNGRRHSIAGGLRLTIGGAIVARRISEWRRGRTLRMPVSLRRAERYLNPGVADQELALAHAGTTLLGSVKSAALVEVLRHGPMFEELAASARAATRRALSHAVGRWSLESAAIVTAILIGDRAGLSDDVSRRLQEAGTFHVIAISGGNLAILAGVLFYIMRRAGVAPRASSAFVLLGVSIYAGIVTAGASVVRAAIVAIIYLMARAADHKTPALNAVAVTGLIVLAVWPLAIFDGGFALSFGATLGILLGSTRSAAWLGRLIRTADRGARVRAAVSPVMTLFAGTICAEAALLPLSAFLFGRVTFAGLLLNFIAIPLMTIAQVVGLITLALTPFNETAAAGAGYIAHLAANGLVESARGVEYVPWLSIRVPPPSTLVLMLYYAALTAWVASGNFVLVRGAACTVTLAVLIWIAIGSPPVGRRGPAEARLRLTMLDVGQAEAILVRFPAGRSMLVDAAGVLGGGFDVGSRVIAPSLWFQGVRRLDVMLLTHGDPDHVGGALAVLRDFAPREVWEGIPVPPHVPMRVVHAAAVQAGAGWREVRAGDRHVIDGVEILIRHPPAPDWERRKVRNDDSVVMELRYGSVSVLLTGDIQDEGERTVVGSLDASRLRILKVPHHGSRTSSSPGLLRAAAPTIALVSAGRSNRFGHPDPGVLARYSDAGAPIFRTDQDGAVLLETDGTEVAIETMAGRRSVVTARTP